MPEEIALAGFANTPLIDLLNPSLTSVKQPAFEMGQVATELLIKLIESKKAVTEFETIVLQTEVEARDSSAPKNKKTMS